MVNAKNFILTILLLHILLVVSLQIKRKRNGDKVISGERCDRRTYVFGGSQTKPGRCVPNIKEAGCYWEFKSKLSTFGFVAKETIKATTFNITLLEKTQFPTGQLCRNYSDGRTEVQNTNVYLNTSIWDINIGKHIKHTLTYQFDYAKKFVTVGFAKHWDGMLIKLFINCLDVNGNNISEAAGERCVMFKYEGTATYPLKGTQTTSTTTTTRTQTSSTTTNDFTKTTKVTDPLSRSTFHPASTTTSAKTQPVCLCSNETKNALIGLLSGFGWMFYMFMSCYFNWKEEEFSNNINPLEK